MSLPELGREYNRRPGAPHSSPRLERQNKRLVNLTTRPSNYPSCRAHCGEFSRVSRWCVFCFAVVAVRNPILIRGSMKLIKEITDVLREIISSNDEESLRQLQQIVRAFIEARHDLGNRALH